MISVLIILVFLIIVVFCIVVGLGGKKVENKIILGQQLIDLKNVWDEGVLFVQEYEELREKLK